MHIEGKAALVTGAGSGLGLAVAKMIVASGGSVTILDVAEENGRKAASALGDRALFVKTDVTSEEDVGGAIEQAIAQFGPIHIAVNCAGVGSAAKVVDNDGNPMPLVLFEFVIKVNLLGSFNVMRLMAARMVRNDPTDGRERGVIVNTASVAAFEGQIGQIAYSASKGGIVGMTLPAARDLAKHGIRVVTIAPGVFDTPLMASLPEKARVALGRSVPFPSRLGDPDEYASLAAEIIRNPMLNGETIRLDGALRMAPR